jgi:phasin family protein
VADKEKNTGGSDNPFGMPDFSQMLEQMQMPGVDLSQMAEDARKNMEAIQAANQEVAAGWQTLAEKQMEMFREAMERWQSSMSPPSSDGASMEKQAELAREGFERALENMRELAEIASESQTKAFEIMRARFEENMRGMFSSSTSSGKDPE